MNLIRPLVWPSGVPRTAERKFGRFGTEKQVSDYYRTLSMTVADALDRLGVELERFGASRVEVCAMFQASRSGNAMRDWKKSDDPGVIVAFDRDGKPYQLPCDTYTELPQNIAAIAAHLSAVRAIERYGVGTIEQMMGAFQSLPERSSIARHWSEVLEVSASASREVIEAAYRTKVKQVHPDHGGSPAQFAEVQRARKEALGE